MITCCAKPDVEGRTCVAWALEGHFKARIAQPAEDEAQLLEVAVEAAAPHRNAFGFGGVKRWTGKKFRLASG